MNDSGYNGHFVKKTMFRVEIDCGHGKSTPNKRSVDANLGLTDSPYYLLEYKFNRELGKLLEKKLLDIGFQVNFTVNPDDDTDISLKDRYTRANEDQKNHPDCKCIFVSIHANAAGNGLEWKSARGFSVYTTKGENNSDILADCVLKVAQEELPKYKQKIRIYKNEYMKLDWEENFTVIYGAAMPAILVENMFMDNKQDVLFLNSEEGKNVLANIITKGIVDYFGLKYPFEI